MSVPATASPVEVTTSAPLPALPADNSAEALISQAVANGASIDTLERLIALREKVLAEKAKEAFNAAMAAFQAECPVIKKTKEVKTKAGVVAYRYAPIESAVIQVKELIQKHGFRYSTTMELHEGRVKAFCRVVHTLGYEEVSAMEVPLGTKTDIMSQSQVVAAASTFAKRYAFLNAFGIMTGDEDNDTAPERGDAPGKQSPTEAVGIKKEQSPDKPKLVTAVSLAPKLGIVVDPNSPATAEQVREIAALTKQLGGTVQVLYADGGIKGRPTKKQANNMLDALRKRTGVPTDAELAKAETARPVSEEENATAEKTAQLAA